MLTALSGKKVELPAVNWKNNVVENGFKGV